MSPKSDLLTSISLKKKIFCLISLTLNAYMILKCYKFIPIKLSIVRKVVSAFYPTNNTVCN
jgi:hypothetical protein